MSEPFDDDDIPWASPEIRLKYEAALGKFLLVFNQIDHTILHLTEIVLSHHNRRDLANKVFQEDFGARIFILDLLKNTEAGKGVEKVDFAALKQLSSDRALLAHAHMEQNPFDGDYRLYLRGRDKGKGFTEARINGLAEKANELWEQLRYAEAYYMFDDLTVIEPPSNSEPS